MFTLVIGASLLIYGWKMHDRAVLSVALCILLFGVGSIRLTHIQGKESVFPSFGRVTLVGRVVEYPDIRDTSVRVVLQTEKERERVLVSLPVGTQFLYGDVVSVSGIISVPTDFNTDSGRIFDYSSYLRREGILRQVSFAEAKRIHKAPLSLKGILFQSRATIESHVRSVMPEPESSLVLGMLLGGKSGLGTGLTTTFTRAGIVHIVVLSGYNITIAAELVRRVLSGVPFFARMWGSGITIILFIIMAGADASAVRAGCMAVIALIARATGRPYVALRALALTALAMGLWNPLILLYDPGFILSVCATLGIIVLTDPILKRLMFIRWNLLKEIIAASLAAYCAVLPYLAFQIGAVSIIALVVNPLVLPFVPLAMLLGAITGVLAFIPGPLVLLAAFPLTLLLRVLIVITQLFSSLPFASIAVPAWSGVVIAFIYGVLGAYWARRRQTMARQEKSPDTLAQLGHTDE